MGERSPFPVRRTGLSWCRKFAPMGCKKTSSLNWALESPFPQQPHSERVQWRMLLSANRHPAWITSSEYELIDQAGVDHGVAHRATRRLRHRDHREANRFGALAEHG